MCSMPLSCLFVEEYLDFPVDVFGIHVGIIAVQFAAVPDRLPLLQPVDDGGSVQISHFGLVSGFPIFIMPIRWHSFFPSSP